jgi:anti-sigma B factor antagonist
MAARADRATPASPSPSDPSARLPVIVDFAVSEPRRERETTVLAVEGELDLAAAPRLEQPLRSALREADRGVVLDLSGVTFMDSTAFRVLSQAKRRHGHVPLAIVCPRHNVLRIFRIAGIDKDFPLFPTLDEAIAYVREEGPSRS